MKKTIVLQIILSLLLVTGKSFATTTDDSPESVMSSTNQDFIIIVDILGIGSTGASYSDVCIGTTGTNVTSGQTIPLPQADGSLEFIDAVEIGFNALSSPVPNTFVDFHAWIDCKGRVVFADIHLWGAMRQTTIRDMVTREIIEVRFYVQFSPTLIRVYEAPGGGGIIAEMTSAEGIYCTGSPYDNDCFSGQIELRSDDVSVIDEAVTTSLKVQPNPFTTSFESILHLTQEAEVKVALLDLMGREVRSMVFAGTKGANQFSIDGDDLSAGMYVLSVQTGQERMVERVMKK